MRPRRKVPARPGHFCDVSTPDRAAAADDDDRAPGDRSPSDAERFNALWDAYSHRVQAYAMRHTDADTASEVVSETFLIAWRRLADVPGEAMPWLLVVARNTIRNAHRSSYRARALRAELARIAAVLPPVTPGAEETALEREALLRALATLTPKEREAVLLTSWDGLTGAEAARVADCSVSAFQVRLHRARRRLRVALTPEPDPDDDAEPALARRLTNARLTSAQPTSRAAATVAPREHAVLALEGD